MSGVGLRKLFPWVCETAQQVKALGTKLDDLSSTCGRYWKLLTTLVTSTRTVVRVLPRINTHSKYIANKVVRPQTWTNGDGRHLRGPSPAPLSLGCSRDQITNFPKRLARLCKLDPFFPKHAETSIPGEQKKKPRRLKLLP